MPRASSPSTRAWWWRSPNRGAGRSSVPIRALWSRAITLRKGLRFRMRPIRPEDEAALTAMVEACTPEDLRLRFFAPLKSLPHRTAARFSQIDYDREMAFVAVASESAYGEGPVFGVVRLISDSENETGEFAVLVRSDLKGTGLGRRLMQEILYYAGRRGLRRIEGDVLRENTAMLRLCRDLGMQARPAGDMSDAVRMAADLSA